MTSVNILEEIVNKRKADIEKLGYTFGCSIPDKRKRDVTPFIIKKGSILEIKRASPSKGNIAPLLDAKKTALDYASAGTSAISVLTESNYFKGSLNDLMDVCEVIDSYSKNCPVAEKVSILRKDFLLCPEEVEIAYRCGADAVLLIGRILDDETLLAMAKKCQELGITAFIELRLKEDLDKLSRVVKEVKTEYIVCGVNARDLKDFSIDFLTPASMLESIKSIMGSNARVVFESGIRTADAAHFAGSLGFTGMLLGEAAAKNPSDSGKLVSAFVNSKACSNSLFWNDYAKKMQNRKKPFVKICGITNEEDAIKACELGADFLGFIFCNKSPRKVVPFAVPGIAVELDKAGYRDKVKLIGVVTDINSNEAHFALDLLQSGGLDAIQLHGCGSDLSDKTFDCDTAHYTAVNINKEEDIDKIDELKLIGESRILIDAKDGNTIGGTGKSISEILIDKVSKKIKLWLAGGITPDNVNQIIERFNPELIDVASGVEEKPGKKDFAKLEKLFNEINRLKI